MNIVDLVFTLLILIPGGLLVTGGFVYLVLDLFSPAWFLRALAARARRIAEARRADADG